MKIWKTGTIFLDKKLTKVILSNDLMELFSPPKKRGFRMRVADPLPIIFHRTLLSDDRRAL